MRSCPQARHLFSAYWDDEITQGERDWLDSHLAGCEGCRASYNRYAQTLEAVGTLPRPEMAVDLAERALGEAKRRQRVPDVLAQPQRPTWQPVAAAASLALVALTSMMLLRAPGPSSSSVALERPVEQPRLVSVDIPMGSSLTTPESDAHRGVVSSSASDSLFDHTADVEFILDPVTLRRGRAHTARLPDGVQGEQALISF